MRRLILLTTVLGALAVIGCEPAANNTASNANRAANGANNAAPQTSANTEAEVKKTLEEVAAGLAKNDADAVAKYYSDDYILITPQGTVQNKTQRLADMKSGNTKFDSFAYEDIKVRPFGNTAVATATVTAKGKTEGRDVAPKIRATLVLVKVGNEWKVVSGQATAVAEAKPGDKPANANTSNANAGSTNAAKPSPSPANK